VDVVADHATLRYSCSYSSIMRSALQVRTAWARAASRDSPEDRRMAAASPRTSSGSARVAHCSVTSSGIAPRAKAATGVHSSLGPSTACQKRASSRTILRKLLPHPAATSMRPAIWHRSKPLRGRILRAAKPTPTAMANPVAGVVGGGAAGAIGATAHRATAISQQPRVRISTSVPTTTSARTGRRANRRYQPARRQPMHRHSSPCLGQNLRRSPRLRFPTRNPRANANRRAAAPRFANPHRFSAAARLR